MKNRCIFYASYFVCIWFSLSTAGWAGDVAQSAPPVQLTAAGSGVNLGITRLLAEAFTNRHPNIKFEIPGSVGTRGAITAVAEGAIALGLISRPLKEDEKALGIVALPYARVAIVIGVNSIVQDDAINSSDLIEIFRGSKTRWRDGSTIIVQSREKSDSGFLVLQEKIPGFKEVFGESQEAKRWTLYFTDQDANQALSSTLYAIGVTDLGMIATERLNVKALKLNGIAPDPGNVLNGTYPLSRQLSFVYRPGHLPDGAKAFLDFVASKAGRALLEAKNYIALQ